MITKKYRNVNYTHTKQELWSVVENRMKVYDYFMCNDKELLSKYDTKQFVVHFESNMEDRIDYFKDKYDYYLRGKQVEANAITTFYETLTNKGD